LQTQKAIFLLSSSKAISSLVAISVALSDFALSSSKREIIEAWIGVTLNLKLPFSKCNVRVAEPRLGLKLTVLSLLKD
jgi:hypothetical protein